jgi:hypothetical protein
MSEDRLDRIEKLLGQIAAKLDHVSAVAHSGTCAGTCGSPFSHTFTLSDGRCSACGKMRPTFLKT